MLCLGVLVASNQLNVLVTGVQLLCQVHLHTGGCGNNDSSSTVLLEQLRQNQTGRTGTEQENLDTDLRSQFVETVDGARRGLKKGSLLVGQVLESVQLGVVAEKTDSQLQPCVNCIAYLYSLGDVFSETTVHLDTLGGEVFTQKAFTSSAVETSATRL